MKTHYKPATELRDHFLSTRVVSRIWARDASVWNAAPNSADARSIASRLGWLDVAETMTPHLEQVESLAEAVRRERIEAVYLLGMGGSSLCGEVLRSVFGIADGFPSLFVFDTTDEQTLTTAAGRLDPERTWFLVSSKSGGTVEVASMERFFWSNISAALGDRARDHFIAITDPGTALQSLAESRGYRSVFINPADIGGRFSALSLFGLVPTALIGSSARELLSAASAMADGCRQENHENPGFELGAFIGAAAREGRDKLTVVLPPSLSSLGLWIEQLVAESTGKHGKGALPVVDEPLGRPDEYGQDRAFVTIATDRDHVDGHALDALEKAGHPVLRLSSRIDGLGAEFFRWEFATAVSGAALGINPFDEPNVSEAKEKTKALLGSYATTSRLPEPTATASSQDEAIFSSSVSGASPPAAIGAALDSLRAGDYVAFLSYLPPDADLETAILGIRTAIRSRYHVATTFGVGPRYLHSTGQYHKGGPNTVLAFVLTADDETQTPIPEAGYSFSVLKRAQALGDVQTLDAHGRRTLRIHLKDHRAAAATLQRLFAEALD
jgi:glucose-6-phosphate isomerase